MNVVGNLAFHEKQNGLFSVHEKKKTLDISRITGTCKINAILKVN